MLGGIPVICFVLIWLTFKKARPTAGWRSAFLCAAIVWGLLVTAITEGLSIFHWLSGGAVLAAWVVCAAIAAIAVVRGQARASALRPQWLPAGLGRFEWVLVGVMAVVVVTVGVTAAVAAPNTWDSMTYHISRVMHWIQNGSVAPYPTHILRQLHQNPWAEFATLQFQVLSGGDRWANLVQCFSMVGSALGVTLIALELGAGRRGQIFAAVVSLTIPMGILQGSSTQNDYVVSFWLVCFTYFALRLRAAGRGQLAWVVGAGLGLAILTKATAYLFALPLMAWLSLSLVKSRRAHGLLPIGLIVATALAINLGHYTRNYQLYGTPLGPSEETGGFKYANDVFSLSTTASNLLRNVGLHLGLPFPAVNEALERAVYNLYRATGFDPNDPRTTWADTQFHITFANDENTAGNPVQVMFIIAAGVIVGWQARRQRVGLYYAVCLVGAFIIFCFYLRWQPWHSRLHLPLFILWSAFVGLVFGQIQPQRIANWCLIILLVGADPLLPLLLNPTRPWVTSASIFETSRTEAYFSGRREIGRSYIDAGQFLATISCTEIGLILGGNDYEYPLWPLLSGAGQATVRLEHVNVTNLSAGLLQTNPFTTFRACAVLVVSDVPPMEVKVGDVTLRQAWASAPVSVFLETTPAP